MPIIFKPIHPDRWNDGFDPLFPSQMIPLRESREMQVHTEGMKAELDLKDLTTKGVSSMSNFMLVSGQPGPLPGPTTHVQKVTLQENAHIQFTLSGQAVGYTTLVARDLPSHGYPPHSPDFQLTIAVKSQQARLYAVCYVFDRINRDTGKRLKFDYMSGAVQSTFLKQANFQIMCVDSHTVSTPQARAITLNGSFGKTFDASDRKLWARIVDAFEAKYPGVFAQIHAVVFLIGVPMVGKKVGAILGRNVCSRRKSNGRIYNFVFLGPKSVKQSDQGGGQDPVLRLANTLAHEIGHSLGLSHDPIAEQPSLAGKKPNPEWYKLQSHNLMFPTSLIHSFRLNAVQVEVLHSAGLAGSQPDGLDF